MHTNTFKKVQQEILEIISQSHIPEDYPHAKSVREWVLKLKPDAGFALQIAALAHDIERALAEGKVKRKEYRDYNAFKKAHAANSALIVSEILNKYPLDKNTKNRITHLVEQHEFVTDNDRELSVLTDADSISFFEVNLPFYFQRNSEQETFFRMRWGYKRLSGRAKRVIRKFDYRNERVNHLLKKCISSE
jgi:hypothetical protein